MNINNRELSEPEVKAYINDMKKLLRELQPVLRAAFFANYKDQNKADELKNRIERIVGGSKK
jgi:hypothetical protein